MDPFLVITNAIKKVKFFQKNILITDASDPPPKNWRLSSVVCGLHAFRPKLKMFVNRLDNYSIDGKGGS